MKNKHLIAFLSLALCVGSSAAALGAADDVKMGLTRYAEAGTAGVPIVVDITFRNEGQEDATVYSPLGDSYTLYWEWKSAKGITYSITPQNYGHAGTGGEPKQPKPVILKPGEKVSWRTNVPTPTDIQEDGKWTLTKLSASMELTLKKMPNNSVATALGATNAQAAVMEPPFMSTVIPLLEKQDKFQTVQACADKGDSLAQLILFAQALLNQKELVKHWEALEKSVVEVRCLRNYLLLVNMGRLSRHDHLVLSQLIDKNAPFGAELLNIPVPPAPPIAAPVLTEDEELASILPKQCVTIMNLINHPRAVGGEKGFEAYTAKYCAQDFLYNGQWNRVEAIKRLTEGVKALGNAGGKLEHRLFSVEAKEKDMVVTIQCAIKLGDMTKEQQWRFVVRKVKDKPAQMEDFLIQSWDGDLLGVINDLIKNSEQNEPPTPKNNGNPK